MRKVTAALTTVTALAILVGVLTLGVVHEAGAPPQQPPLNVNVLNDSVDVNVVNDALSPVPVSLIPPATTAMCTLPRVGRSGSNLPFVQLQGSHPQTLVACPTGVVEIDVQRIGFSPDVGPFDASVNVATFRITVGSGPEFAPPGILAVLTEGAPDALVAQPLRLDTTNPDANIWWVASMSSGIATVGLVGTGTLFFVGTPVP